MLPPSASSGLGRYGARSIFSGLLPGLGTGNRRSLGKGPSLLLGTRSHFFAASQIRSFLHPSCDHIVSSGAALPGHDGPVAKLHPKMAGIVTVLSMRSERPGYAAAKVSERERGWDIEAYCAQRAKRSLRSLFFLSRSAVQPSPNHTIFWPAVLVGPLSLVQDRFGRDNTPAILAKLHDVC